MMTAIAFNPLAVPHKGRCWQMVFVVVKLSKFHFGIGNARRDSESTWASVADLKGAEQRGVAVISESNLARTKRNEKLESINSLGVQFAT